MSSLSRRGLLAGSAALSALALALEPTLATAAEPPQRRAIPFTLNAEVLDGGEQVVSLTLDTTGLGGIDPARLTSGLFQVHVTSVSPVPTPPGSIVFNAYEGLRTVTAVRLDRTRLVVELQYGQGVPGASTLGYVYPTGRNVRLDLTYTITQLAPIPLRNGGSLWLAGFAQGRLLSPEVEAYGRFVSGTRMNYRLYSPAKAGKNNLRPLIVWLHGGGEGGSMTLGYYDNETPLRANRGALGFSTPEAQAIFGGAFVVAPQAESFWLENGPAYAPRVKALIDELVAKYPIDTQRIHVVGCSNGGYMSMEMTSAYKTTFASSVPICGLLNIAPSILTDADLAAISTPTWLVASRNDPVVNYAANTGHAATVIPNARLTAYDTVTWNGTTYNGHWSWIYVARNDPQIGGQHIWQWMAGQTR